MKKTLIVIFTLILAAALSACQGGGASSAVDSANSVDSAVDSSGANQQSNESRQLIEVFRGSGEFAGTLFDNGKISEFTENLMITQWKYLDSLPENASYVCAFVTYTVVDDPALLDGGEPFVNQSLLEIYELEGEFFACDKDYTAQIPLQAGQYLSAPEAMGLDGDKTAADIFKQWDLNIIVDSAAEQPEHAASGATFTIAALESMADYHKLQIYGADENELLYETRAIDTVAGYLNGIGLTSWAGIDSVPEGAAKMYTVAHSSMSGRQPDAQAAELYTHTFYAANGKCYVSEVLPDGTVTGLYEIPKSVVEFVGELSQR